MSSNSSTTQTSKSKSHPEFPSPQIDNQNAGYSDCRASSTGCWDFLQQTVTKPSTFFLNTRSLEMCTEILGSESGSYIDPILDQGPHTTQERQCYSSRIKPRKTQEMCKKTKHITNFPPPLTSISSGYGVKVEAHRGGGRLVITAFVSSSACRIYLKSERENGRLRVFLHKEYYYRRSERQLAEKIKENGGKIRRNFKCGDESGSKNFTSLPLCLV